MRGEVYLRSLETKFSVVSSSTICLITDSKIKLCVLLIGQHIQKVKNNFLFVHCAQRASNYFLAGDLLLNMD